MRTTTHAVPTVTCEREKGCARCRDLHLRRVKAAVSYDLAALCELCGEFVRQVLRAERRAAQAARSAQ